MPERFQWLIRHVQNLSYKRKLLLTCLTVSILPLSITTVFCVSQMTSSLLRQEDIALRETLSTASDSLSFQIELYRNLVQNAADSDAVISTASRTYDTVYDKYAQFSYTFDVFLNNLTTQHPEIEQITLYTGRNELRHGKQLRTLSDLEQEPWFTANVEDLTAEPQWFIREDGAVVLICLVPEPYTKYVKAYSQNCVAMTIPGDTFFYFLESLSDCHLRISNGDTVFFDYTDPKMSGILSGTPLTSLSADFSTRRIDQVNRTMQVVQTGDFSVRLHDDCEDEIGVLTNNFQTMADKIQTLIQDNYQKTITLSDLHGFLRLRSEKCQRTLDPDLWGSIRSENQQHPEPEHHDYFLSAGIAPCAETGNGSLTFPTAPYIFSNLS